MSTHRSAIVVHINKIVFIRHSTRMSSLSEILNCFPLAKKGWRPETKQFESFCLCVQSSWMFNEASVEAACDWLSFAKILVGTFRSTKCIKITLKTCLNIQIAYVFKYSSIKVWFKDCHWHYYVLAHYSYYPKMNQNVYNHSHLGVTE